MSTTPAVTPQVDSAPTEPSSLPELSTLNAEQRAEWKRTGDMPLKQDSAPAKKEAAVADSAPQKKEAVSASDSAPEKKPQPHRKPEDYGEKRFQELANENKSLKERLDAIERERKAPEKRDDKQVSQPAPEYKPLDEKKYFSDNPKATYEDFVRAAAKHEAKWEAGQEVQKAITAERQRIAQESAAKELQSKLNDAKERYGDQEAAKIIPAVDKIVGDAQIPQVIKAMLDRSDVLVDLAYTLGSDSAEFDKFVALCKSDPAGALEKLITVQSLVREQLKANVKKAVKAEKEPEPVVPEVAAEPVTRAPRPPSKLEAEPPAVKTACVRRSKVETSAKQRKNSPAPTQPLTSKAEKALGHSWQTISSPLAGFR